MSDSPSLREATQRDLSMHKRKHAEMPTYPSAFKIYEKLISKRAGK
jgi:hypothetical protein